MLKKPKIQWSKTYYNLKYYVPKDVMNQNFLLSKTCYYPKIVMIQNNKIQIFMIRYDIIQKHDSKGYYQKM